MLKGRFTERDADTLLATIRSSYDEYCTRYGKPASLKERFELRYISALRSRMNLEAFLTAEESAVRDLLSQASQRRDRDEQIRLVRTRRMELRERSLRQEQEEDETEDPRSILRYPEYPLDVASSETVRRLFGAFAQLEREYWPSLDRIMRKLFPRNLPWSRVDLENSFFLLAIPSEKRLPSALERYVGALERGDHDMAAVAKEEHRCMHDAAFFSDRFVRTLAQIRNNRGMSDEEDRIVLESITYAEGIMIDFHLREFLR